MRRRIADDFSPIVSRPFHFLLLYLRKQQLDALNIGIIPHKGFQLFRGGLSIKFRDFIDHGKQA